MRSRDTSEKAAAIQARLQDALGPEGRMQMALRMSDFAREFAKAAIRDRHPEYSEAQLTFELTRQLHGRRGPGIQ
jgi:hypothetical protein